MSAVNDRHLTITALNGAETTEFWADQPVAQEVFAMLADLEAEHQRHRDAITAVTARLHAYVQLFGAGAQPAGDAAYDTIAFHIGHRW